MGFGLHSYRRMNHGTVTFCTELMAKQLLFLPFEMAPGHLIDLRDLHAAQLRMEVAIERLTEQPQQLDLFH